MNGELDNLISMSELIDKLGLSKSTIYKMIKEDTFPAPIKIGSRRIAWRVAAVDEWLNNREMVS